MFMWFKDKKTHYFPNTVHYCCSSMLCLSETRPFSHSSLFWEAKCALIGQLSSALWLVEYLKRVWRNVTPLPYCDGVFRRDETKTIKPIRNDNTFVESSGDIITVIMTYTIFLCVASGRVNITMSAFVIEETTNNKRYSTQLKTHVWIVSGKFFKYESILTGCESEVPDCPCKVGIAPLHRNSLCAQLVL